MNTHSLCCIGYITQDKVVTPKNTIYMPGGTSFYFAHAIKHLNANDFLLVTALADTDMGIVEDIRKEGISVKALHSTHSVCFENIYGENQNERTQRVTAKAATAAGTPADDIGGPRPGGGAGWRCCCPGQRWSGPPAGCGHSYGR